MRIVLQRVKRARVSVDGATVGVIDAGILVLLGVHGTDTPLQADALARKCAEVRIFDDAQGKMNLSLLDTGGSVLVVSQFTLYGDCRKGRRPSFIEAAPPGPAQELYEYFVAKLRELIPRVATGVFGATMEVELLNDGPVTLVLEASAQGPAAKTQVPNNP